MTNFFPAFVKNNSAAPTDSASAEPGQGVVRLSERDLDQVVGGFALSLVGPLAPVGASMAGSFLAPSAVGVSAFGPLGSPSRFSASLSGLGGIGRLGGVMASVGGIRGGGFSASGAGSE